MRKDTNEHEREIVEQFSKQAIPFSQVPGHASAMEKIIALSRVTDSDSVLDVACGPGILACEIARHAKFVTGVDITDAMLAEARKRQRGQGISNAEWVHGNAVPLPFAMEEFDVVVTRYSFHHFIDAEKALAEMIRVCRRGGTVLVADVSLPSANVKAYDEMEIIRDPSHTHALSEEEFDGMFARSGLINCERTSYSVELDLETQLAASFPAEGGTAVLRELVRNDIGIDNLGINARYENGKVFYSCPISVYAGIKP